MTFEYLLELISENKHNEIITKQGERYEEAFQDFFDWTDDVLLSISLQFQQNPENIDDYFRQTLAYIQAKNDSNLNQNDVIDFLKARLKAIDKQTEGKDKKRIVASGLPLASALKLYEIWDSIEKATDEYLDSDKTIDDKIQLLEKTEGIMKLMPSNVFTKTDFSGDQITAVRSPWLKGEKIGEIKESSKIISNYFGYSVAWFLGAVANQYRKKLTSEKEDNTMLLVDELYEIQPDKADIFEELAACCELGLPNLLAVKVYLAGIKSRKASIEISAFLKIDSSVSILAVKNKIEENTASIKENQNLSKQSIQWIEVYERALETNKEEQRRTKERKFRKRLDSLLNRNR